jgi:uncharacterized protein
VDNLDQLARPEPSWEEGRAKNITFIVTEDCQLRCKYCYLVGKNPGRRMETAVARQAVDYILRERAHFAEPSVVWEFIGGEPLLEIDLIDNISDYIKLRLYQADHPWFESYRFSLSTNGLMYDDPRVQRYIAKNRTHVSIGITIDGIREKHDLMRVFPDGRGSYDAVAARIPLWLRQFPDAATKVTIAHDDLPHIKDSVLHLWELGVRTVNINVVFEDVWQPGDDALFEQQLIGLADAIVDRGLYRRFRCSFFDDAIGRPLDPAGDNQNWCGSGKMLAIGAKGEFYPCVRFAPHSMSRQAPRSVGNCSGGLDTNRLRPFLALTRLAQSPPECVACEIASGCAWCQGLNYECSDTATIYQRATYICPMHKARVRANRHYWDRLRRKLGENAC